MVCFLPDMIAWVCSSNSKSLQPAPGRRKGEHGVSPSSLQAWLHRDYSQEVFWSPYPSLPVRPWRGTHRPTSLQPLFLPSSLLLYSDHHPNRHLSQDTSVYTILENVGQRTLVKKNSKNKAKSLFYATACSPWIMRDSGHSWWLNSSLHKAWVWVHLYLWMGCGSKMT